MDYASVTSMIHCRLVVTLPTYFMVDWLGFESFLNYLRIGIGVGVRVSVSLKFVRFCRPLMNDFKVTRRNA